MFDAYRQALRAPGAKAFYVAAAPARVGIAMTVLGMVWLGHGTTGSFAQAALATSAFALTEAVIGPQNARLIDAFGQTRVVPLLLAAHGVCVAGLIAGGPAILLAGLAGATIPQVGALAAARWSHVVSGPLLGGGLALCAQRGSAPPPTRSGVRARRGAPGALRIPKRSRLTWSDGEAPAGAGGAARLLAAARRPGPPAGVGRIVAANLALRCVFGALQVSVTAFAVERDASAYAGPIYAITSAASLVSGFGAPGR
jgi:hypothetical protein